MKQPSIAMLIIGTIVFTVTTTAWLICAFNGFDASGMLFFAVPVIGSLFLVDGIRTLYSGVGQARDAAERAANQTNGALDGRIQAAVSQALAVRDAARTWQAVQSPVTPPNPVSEDVSENKGVGG